MFSIRLAVRDLRFHAIKGMTLSLLLLASIPGAPANALAWTQNTFVIALWNDPCFDPRKDTFKTALPRFQAVRSAHFNLIGAAEDHNLSNIDTKLDLCAASGLSTLVIVDGLDGHPGINLRCPSTYDSTCSDPFPSDCRPFADCRPFNREGFYYALDSRRHFRPGALSAARRAAFYGYFLGDDIPDLAFVNLKNVLQRYKSYDSGALACINLSPEFENNLTEYRNYLNHMCNDPDPTRRPDVIAFYHYPFDSTKGMRSDYFENLSVIRQAAGTRPFWATPLTTRITDVHTHSGTTEPTTSQILFMVNCPIAYGAKGLRYFTYGQNHPNNGGFGHAIVDNCDQLTWKYALVRDTNYYLEQIVGPVVMSSQLLGTYHAATYPSNQIIPGNELFTSDRAPLVASIAPQQMLCAVFKESTYSYLWIVNKDVEHAVETSISLKGNRSGLVALGPSEVNYSGSLTYNTLLTTYDPTHNVTWLPVLTLQPGEGRLLRIA